MLLVLCMMFVLQELAIATLVLHLMMFFMRLLPDLIAMEDLIRPSLMPHVALTMLLILVLLTMKLLLISIRAILILLVNLTSLFADILFFATAVMLMSTLSTRTVLMVTLVSVLAVIWVRMLREILLS